jgi:hypothetical protein
MHYASCGVAILSRCGAATLTNCCLALKLHPKIALSGMETGASILNDPGNSHWRKHLCEGVIEAYERAMKGI